MTERISLHRLQVSKELHDFIESEALPGTGVDAAAFWSGFDAIAHDLTPRNRELLAQRDQLQARLDEWHRANPGPIADADAYETFLREIGYLQPEPASVSLATSKVDTEFSQQAGPQLVVPVTNARYALNAANARWGSLYDALYGTDAIPETDGAERAGGYNPVRGEKVIAFARRFLDESAPLEQASHTEATAYAVVDGRLQVTLQNGKTTTLQDASLLQGYRG